jgi:hypothetical protein
LIRYVPLKEAELEAISASVRFRLRQFGLDPERSVRDQIRDREREDPYFGMAPDVEEHLVAARSAMVATELALSRASMRLVG